MMVPFRLVWFLSLRFNGNFPGEPRLADVYWRMMEMVVTTGTKSRAKLQSNHHHQQTNIQFFTGRMPFLSRNQQCQSTESLLVSNGTFSTNTPYRAIEVWYILYKAGGQKKTQTKQWNNTINQDNHNTLRPELSGDDPLTMIRLPQRSLSSQSLGK